VGRRTSTRVFCAAVLAVVVTAALGTSAGAASFNITPGGPAVTVTISNAGTNATATFAGTKGQRVSLNISGSTISSFKVSLLKPSGSALFTVSATRTAKFVDTNTLPATGTYKLVVDPNNNYTGKVTLQLYNVPADASANAIVGGAPGTVTTTVPGQDAYVTFSGVAGHRLSLSLTGVTISAGNVTVLNPDQSTLSPTRAFARADSFIDPLTLPATGQYKVVLDPKGKATGAVTVTAYDVPADKSVALTLGSPTNNTIDVPGQRASFTFAGTIGQRVSLNVQSSDFNGTISLLRFGGASLASVAISPAGGFVDTVVLPATETYTVLVDPSGAQTGAFGFVAYNVPADPTPAILAGGSAVTATTTVPGQNVYLTFNGTVGQKISVLVSNVSGIDPAELNLFKPDGKPAIPGPLTVTSSGAWLQTTSLTMTGEYKILLDPQQANVGSADVNLYTVPADLGGPITPNTPLSIATTAPGQNAAYTFSASIGQRLSLNLTGVTIQSVKVTIQKPDGTPLATKTVGTTGGFIDTTAALTVGGTYKVLVDPQSSYFGGITLGLYVVPADQTGSLTSGVGKTFTTSVPGQNAKWTFSAMANQRLSFSFTGVTMPSVRVTVKTAGGAQFMTKTFSTDGDFIEPITVTTAGTTTYTVTVDPQGASIGNVTVTYYVVPANATATAPNALTITTPGQNGVITFSVTGASADRTFTVSTTVPADACCVDSVELKVFQGSTQVGPSEFAGPSGYSFIRTLGAGTYTIVVDPFGAAVGSVTVSVS
jgi:hypothetical protein